MRPAYHIAPERGWLNDPNGLVYFRGEYHVFYQADPDHTENQKIRWAHVKSRDLLRWERCPDALLPDQEYDADGCFTGSTVEKNGRLYLIYTGHRNLAQGYAETQNVAWSDDGIHFAKYAGNPIIAVPPEDTTMRFRDPKVWKKDGCYYLAIGAEDGRGCGKVVLYSSRDLLHYTYRGVLADSDGDTGNMWECPNFTEWGEKSALIISPKGLSAEKGFSHGFESGFFTGHMDYENLRFQHGDYRKLDAGFDFYAPQVMEAGERKLLWAWFAVPDSCGAEETEGWRHLLTLPRELFLLEDGSLGMRPVPELDMLRQEELEGVSGAGLVEWTLPSASLELQILAETSGELTLEISDGAGTLLTARVRDGKWIFRRRAWESDLWEERSWTEPGALDSAYTERRELRLYLDGTTLELFESGGRMTFSSRLYPAGEFHIRLRQPDESRIRMRGWLM